MNAGVFSDSRNLFSPYFSNLSAASEEDNPPNGVSNSVSTSSLLIVCHKLSISEHLSEVALCLGN